MTQNREIACERVLVQNIRDAYDTSGHMDS